MADPIAASDAWGTRTPHDLSGLFVELGRLLKAVGFYEPGHPVREEMRDRAYQAWTIELDRAGPIELSRQGEHLQCDGPVCRIESSLVRDFVRLLEGHAIEHLLFIPKLDRETFTRFSELLVQGDPDAPQSDSLGFCDRFYASSSGGIEIDRIEHEKPETEASEPRPTASLGSMLLNAPQPPPIEAPKSRDVAADAPVLSEADLSPPTPRQPLVDPLGLALEELEACADDRSYQDLLDRLLRQLRGPDGLHDMAEGYRLALMLADHAAGQSGSSGAQARMAQAALEALCDAAMLDHMLDRTCSRGPGEVRAAQVLLRLGERAVPAVLDRLQRETQLEDRAQLSAIIIALGEHAIPELTRVIANSASRTTQLAVRLAGEIQNPKVIPVLVSVLEKRGKALREEAARALVHIGNDSASEALARALTADDDELRMIAATHLGVLRDERTCPALIRAFDRAWRERKMSVCEVLIGSLGQLTSHREELVRRLSEILHRRRLVWRKKERPCKLAALGVLHREHAVSAHRAVVYATSDPDAVIAKKARELLGGSERGGA